MINPFVGPNPLTKNNALHGRRREVRELLYLLTSERIVLLHSPSGAGKSSLINGGGGLIEKLQEHFTVWRPTRMNLQPGAASLGNRYVSSAIAGFMEDRDGKQRPPISVKASSLEQYVLGRRAAEGVEGGLVLIFDQFEEVLRVDPHDVAEKQEFFRQTGDLLRDPLIWALFVIREDYLAAFEPYSRLIPTHFSNRYRLDLFKREAAQQAFEGLVADGWRSADPKATARLLDDLSTLKVQLPDGTTEERKGEAIYIEPMQLQVVCETLWNQLNDRDLVITEDDISKFGDVTKALSTYYTLAIERIGGEDRGLRWAMRDWFGEKLITPEGIRGQVQERPNESGGLDNKLIAKLEDAHLVRKEIRGRSVWYELSHDRLIQPVLESNAWRFSTFDFGAYYNQQVTAIAGEDKLREQRIRNWVERLITDKGLRTELPAEDAGAASALANSYFLRTKSYDGKIFYHLTHDRLIEPVRKRNAEWLDTHLSWVEQRARLWLANKLESLLLVDEELESAKQWRADNEALLPEVVDYLSASVSLQTSVNNERFRRRATVYGLVVVSVLLLAAIALGVMFWRQKKDTEKAWKHANENAELAKKNEVDAIVAACESERNAKAANDAEEEANDNAVTSVSKMLLAKQAELEYSGKNVEIKTLLTLAAEQLRPSLQGYHFLRSHLTFLPLTKFDRRLTSAESGEFKEIAFSPNGDKLVVLSANDNAGQLVVYSGDPLKPTGLVKPTGPDPQMLTFSEDGQRLGLISDGRLTVMDQNLRELWTHKGVVQYAFHPRLPIVALTAAGSIVWVRRETGQQVAQVSGLCPEPIAGVFSRDATRFAMACVEGIVALDLDPAGKVVLERQNSASYSQLHPNGTSSFLGLTRATESSTALAHFIRKDLNLLAHSIEGAPIAVYASRMENVFAILGANKSLYFKIQPTSQTRTIYKNVTDITFTNDENVRWFALATDNETVTILQRFGAARAADLSLEGNAVQMSFRPKRNEIAVITKRRLLVSEFTAHPPRVPLDAKTSIYGFSDGAGIAAIHQNKNDKEYIQLWNLRDGVELGRWEWHTPLRALAVSYDGKWVAAVGEDRVQLIDRTSQAANLTKPIDLRLNGLVSNRNRALLIGISPNGKSIAYAAWNNGFYQLVVRNLEDGKRNNFPLPSKPTAIAYNSNGNKLVIADETSKLTILEVQNGRRTAVPLQTDANGDFVGVDDVAFSANDKRLVVRNGDRDHVKNAVVHTINIASGEVWEDNDFPKTLQTLGFGEGDNYVYGFEIEDTGADAVVKLRRRPFHMEQMRKDACARLGRNLTAAEWAKYGEDEDYINSCPTPP